MSGRDEERWDWSVGYEPPRVERELTAAELEDEVLYAGPASTQDGSA